MRILMWFAVGFGSACALTAYGQDHLWLLCAAAVLLGLTILALAAWKKPVLLRHAVVILAGFAAGTVWFGGYRMLYLRPMAELGEREALSITVTDHSEDTAYTTAADGRIWVRGRSYPLRIYLKEKMALEPGDRLHGDFRLIRLTGETEGFDAYFRSQGIFLAAYGEGAVRLEHARRELWCIPVVLRHRILQLLEQLFPADTAPFAKALLLGDRGDLDYETTTALEISGILHIVAVSGMHISLLYWVMAGLTFRRRFLTAVVGIPALLLFAAVVDFTPSVMRAVIMVSLTMLAQVFDRQYDTLTALAVSVLAMLMVNPMAVMSVSLQLSVGCVAGILLFYEPLNGWLREKLPQGKPAVWFCSSVSVTVSAMSLITPLSALYFGTVSLVSVVTNLLTLWITSAVFNGVIAVCLVGAVHMELAGFLAQALSWPIRYVLGVAELLASAPLAAVYTKSSCIVWWLVFVYLLFAAFLLLGRKYPGWMLSLGTLGLCGALLLSWNQGEAVITMLDVGQGQCILLQAEGKSFLVDCGGDSDSVSADLAVETLLSRGVTRLDGVILTHYDEDHAGGVRNLLTRMETDLLILPDTRSDWAVPEITGKTVYVWEDLELRAGSASLRIFGPIYSGADNENSLCVLFDTEKCDILITGDRTGFGERMLMRRTDLPDVDILVAGHHADRAAVTAELLSQVKPETVLISAGRDNLYGHPSALVLKRLEDFGCTVYRTDLQGTITIRR